MRFGRDTARCGMAVFVALAGVATTAHANGFGGRPYTATGPRNVVPAPARYYYGGFAPAAQASAPAAVVPSPPVAAAPTVVQPGVQPTIMQAQAAPVHYARRGGMAWRIRGRSR